MSSHKKLVNIDKPKVNSKIVEIDKSKVRENRPIIGLTYLDNSFNLSHLFKKNKGNGQPVKVFEKFLNKARNYSTLTELINAHKPHNGYKSSDGKSRSKMAEIQRKHNVDTTDMCHLHCCRDGNGKFVIHGFRINNCFEIVWIDPEHEIHKLK